MHQTDKPIMYSYSLAETDKDKKKTCIYYLCNNFPRIYIFKADSMYTFKDDNTIDVIIEQDTIWL